jgi:hypothetical protein
MSSILDSAADGSTDDAIPRDCDPNRFVDWRWRYAAHLVQHADSQPIQHEDPWVQAAVDFSVAHQHGWKNRELAETDFAIYEALVMWQNGSLIKDLLEARLLAQEEPEKIAQRSHLSELAIMAYAQLMFDVHGRDRKGIWALHQFRYRCARCASNATL